MYAGAAQDTAMHPTTVLVRRALRLLQAQAKWIQALVQVLRDVLNDNVWAASAGAMYLSKGAGVT